MRDFTIGLMFALFISGLSMAIWDNAKASTDVPVPTNPEYVVLGPSTLQFACDGKVVKIETSNPSVLLVYLVMIEGEMTSDQVLEFLQVNFPEFSESAVKIHSICMPGTHT